MKAGYLLRITKITDLPLAGRTPAQVNDTIAAAVAEKELPPMELEAVCYTMSKEGTAAMSSHTACERDVLLFADRPTTWERTCRALQSLLRKIPWSS